VKTRHIGNCQICERDQKLHKGRMVHHGYRRPGYGSIEGDCPGVDELPYEVSCDLIKTYKVNMEARLAGLVRFAAKLAAREVTSFQLLEHRGYRDVELVEYHAGVTDPYRFERAFERLVRETDRDIEGARFAISRAAKRIEAWRPMPIRTVEEEEAKTAALRADRAKVVADKRAARQAEQARKKQKRDELAARRQAIKDDFAQKLVTLAEAPSDPSSRAEAQKIAFELHKKKYDFIWGLRDLKCEEACIKLGLARREPDGWVRYLE
jgi:hypothetical protein